jgi:dTDP-4-amino-4,6-dideoxygalactose transaminase
MNQPKQTIPAFSLGRQVKNMRPQLIAALEKVIDSQQFIGGKFIEAFEQQLAQYLNVKHVISCNSGTDALWMALSVMDMPQNAIVLTTPFSFIASSSEIAFNNAYPVFIDVDPSTFNISPTLMQQWLEREATMNNGRAIHKATGFPIVGMLPVDLYGQSADYSKLEAIAKQWNLWIIEDCAQALGATYNGKKAGTLGTIGAISFYPTKNLGAFGDAGCCVTDDSLLAEKLLQLRNIGRKRNYEYESLGINSRMDAFQAVILSEKLGQLDQWNARRAQIAQKYNTALAQLPFIKVPQQIVGTHVYHQYSLIVQDCNGESLRTQLEQHLTAHGVQSRIFYPQSLASFAFLNNNPALTTPCPVAENISQRVLALPMWPEMEESEVDYVIECVQSMPYTQVLKTQHSQVAL